MEFISFAMALTTRLDAKQISRSRSLYVRMMVHFVRGKSWIERRMKRFPEDKVCFYVVSFNLRVIKYRNVYSDATESPEMREWSNVGVKSQAPRLPSLLLRPLRNE